ncbi:lytic transglycosylase domain-containing protein [Sphingomonas adhaesiva]|uniref:lytic transglycosylase domain-containing protein n=1 Tax=Sphingomonas adhaesiva TaxID=28212 RepID=UPI002FFBA5CF
MDLVKLSAAGGVAVVAALALATTAGPGAAQSGVADLPAATKNEVIQARIDAAERRPVFDISGPVSPQPAPRVPVLQAPRSRTTWPPLSGATAAWSPYIDEAAARFGLPAAWLHGVMQAESAGRTHRDGVPITSAAGAMGLMQVMPATFATMRARYGLGSDPYDPRTNILAGAAYLREMYDRYGERHFLAAYNAGPGRVDAWLRGRATLPGETRAYTAMLLPRLGFGVPAAYGTTPNAVQDLTSATAMSAFLSSPSRSSDLRPADAASSPVLAGGSARAPLADQHQQITRGDGLFVTLTAADRRREATAQMPGED